ncbi:MAG: cold shock domain-containing protein [Chitinophagales bacterium]
MAKSQQSFNKKELEKNRLKKRQDKQQKMEERKANPKKTDLESMLAYVDEFGNITDTPPDPSKRKMVDASTIEIGVPKREKEDMTAVRNGRVEFFNNSKGFGFIRDQQSGEQFFVHINGLLQPVKENDAVSFELERGNKGMNAVRVKLL